MFEQTDEREPESAGRLASLDHINYRPRYPKRYLLLEPAFFYNRGMADRKIDDRKMKRLDLSVIKFSVSTRRMRSNPWEPIVYDLPERIYE